jgi:hypothetical protein
MEAHYNQTWVKLMPTMRQAHPSGTKPRFYPDAPQDKPYTIDFTPGFDISKSRYALSEPSNYNVGVNPFAARDKHFEDRYDYLFGDLYGDSVPPPPSEDMYANSALQEVNHKIYNRKPSIDRKTALRHERERRLRTKFERDSSDSSAFETPDEAFPAIRELMREQPDYRPVYYEKGVRKTGPQMMRFFNSKGIDHGHTPGELKTQLKEMGLTREYEAYVREERSRGRY